ncbi:MAG TPA: acetolactate synthase large subunit [Nitrososphaerales archaeon]|nr:acetolactate synthase large subunit [Nitrososphaerales archaeon]
MNAADLFVRCLENEGVEYVFGLPGEEIGELLRSFSKSKKIRFVLVRHEQAASFMADVYGRLTGKAGVCVSTLGPGATNLLTGVADAYLDRAPLVAITGQGGLDRMYEESHQYVDIVSAYKFLTKWNRTVTRAKFIPQVVRKAFSVAESEKMGATHIELPEDVASEKISQSSNLVPLKKPRSRPTSAVTKDAVARAVALIRGSSNPVILAGNGVIRSGASEELRRFADAFRMPVVNTFMGKGAISAKDALYVGTIGMPVRDYANCAIDSSDFVITVGYDFVEYGPKRWNSEQGGRNGRLEEKTILHIDTVGAETDQYYIPSLELVGSIKATLHLLVEELHEEQGREGGNVTYGGSARGIEGKFQKVRGQIIRELDKFANDDSFPLKPQRIIYELRRALGAEDILVSDVGIHKLWIARLYPAYEPNTVIISNGFASMGVAFPGAMAAKLARPERRVVAVCGDGGFMMSMYDLQTAKDLDLDLTLLIMEDSKYAQIEWKQKAQFGGSYYVDFENPDLVGVAKALGCKARRIRSARELRSSLENSLNSKGVSTIAVPVDTRENDLLTRRIGENLRCP